MHVAQALNYVFIVAHCNEPDPLVHIQLLNSTYLRLTLNWIARYYLFEKAVLWPGGVVSVDDFGEVGVLLMKNESQTWDETDGIKSFYQGYTPLVLPDYYPTYVHEKIKINKDIFMLRLVNKMDVFSHVSIGKYFHVKKTLNDKEIRQPFYNVPVFPLTNLSYPNVMPGMWMPNRVPTNLIVNGRKGELNKWLASRQVGDEVIISNPQGKFSKDDLHGAACVILLSYEMGITAVLSILLWVMQNSKAMVRLLSFNEYELDLVYFNELLAFQKTKERFKVEFIIGNATYDWHMKIGRPAHQVFDKVLRNEVFDNSSFFCVAGNPFFQNKVVRYVTTHLQFARERVFLFDDFNAKDELEFEGPQKFFPARDTNMY